MGNENKSANFWILSAVLSLILVITISDYLFYNGEFNFPLLGIVFALSGTLLKDIPSLEKLKFLKPVMLSLAVLMIVLWGFFRIS